MNSTTLVIDQKTDKRIVERTVTFFNGLPSYLVILAILVLYFFRFGLDINEDHYMVLAKQYYDPGWVPDSFTFNEFAGPRVLYQLLTGFFLEYFSFELVSAFGKLFLCVAIAFPLLKIYQLLGFSNIDVLLHLPILYFSHQSFVGEEVIFLSYEPKVFAYVFAFFAVYYILIDKFWRATIFLILATYFHILVGGWIMFYFGLYHLVAQKSLKDTAGISVLYIIGMVPFLVYLYPSLYGNFSSMHLPVNLDWIYTYFLKPHHTAIWKDTAYFLKGSLISLSFFIMCLFIFNRYKQEYNQKINLWNIIIFAGTFLSILAAYFDKNGVFVKYFPFRINALFVFLIYLQIVFLARNFFLQEKTIVFFQFGIFAFFFLALFTKAGKHFGLGLYNQISGHQVQAPYRELTAYIKENTAMEDVLLLLPRNADPDNYYTYDMDTEIVRWAERGRFVAFHAAPVSPGTDKLYQWYQRIKAKRKIIEDYHNICSVKDSFKIDYVISDFDLKDSLCYRQVFKNSQYFLYHLKD